jgi:hypothetical protein
VGNWGLVIAKPVNGFKFWHNLPGGCRDIDIGIDGRCFLLHDNSLELAVQNNHGGGDDAAPMVRVTEGWSLPKFVSIGGLGGGMLLRGVLRYGMQQFRLTFVLS